ncbi:hypothetical protein VP150E351_P0082 [Vibrio phage 150E35-1]|nr:hypothetical protein VP150E351_P0082 [Vibrio phage 150E35-1]
MTHKEFLEEFTRGSGRSFYYIVDGSPIHYIQFGRYLKRLGISKEEYYEKYVPNPGCLVCSSNVGLSRGRIADGWSKTCRNECFRALASEITKEIWKSNDSFLEVNRKKFKDFTNTPAARESLFLRNCERFDIKEAHVYVAISKEVVKFGCTISPISRSSKLGMELVYSTDKLDYREAARIERKIMENFPPDIDINSKGYSEMRNISNKDKIVSFIKINIEGNNDEN